MLNPFNIAIQHKTVQSNHINDCFRHRLQLGTYKINCHDGFVRQKIARLSATTFDVMFLTQTFLGA